MKNFKALWLIRSLVVAACGLCTLGVRTVDATDKVAVSQSQSEFPIERLQGLFTYKDHFSVPSIRRAETLDLSSPGSEDRMKELRKGGYTCIRKNQTKRLCSKIWKPETPPEGVAGAISEFMNPITVEFSGGTNSPELIHDGSTTQEWQVNEKIRVMKSELGAYRVVKTNKQTIYIVFPVSESQPLSPLQYHNSKTLSLTIIANTKDSPNSTLAYTIVANLEKN